MLLFFHCRHLRVEFEGAIYLADLTSPNSTMLTKLLSNRAKGMSHATHTMRMGRMLLLLLLLSPSLASAAESTPHSQWQVSEPMVTYWAGPGSHTKLTDETAAQLKAGGWNVGWAKHAEELDPYDADLPAADVCQRWTTAQSAGIPVVNVIQAMIFHAPTNSWRLNSNGLPFERKLQVGLLMRRHPALPHQHASV